MNPEAYGRKLVDTQRGNKTMGYLFLKEKDLILFKVNNHYKLNLI